MKNGKFIISLDFELQWGVRDKKNKGNYGNNIIGVHEVIPRLLRIFSKYNMHVTFSTVGFLFFETKHDLIDNLPLIKPKYFNKFLSPYDDYINSIGKDYKSDLYHFAPILIEEIKKNTEHEIGTHTFSHYYCLEAGQTIESFKSDLVSAISIARLNDISITSLVFPRNQFNEEYLKLCHELGILCYRGNEHSWIYSPKNEKDESIFRRAIRLLDTYINISGYNCYTDEYIKSKVPYNIPSSKFLRPYSKQLSIFEKLKLNRIKSSMTFAAKNNLTYHLWWHPHNFGINQDKNFYLLEKILLHYKELNSLYNFKSYTMTELYYTLKNE